MDDHNAMLQIQELLDGVEWTPDTLDKIADILVSAGYRIRDLEDCDRAGSAVTVCQLADHRLGRKAETGEDFAAAGLAILGGCERCGASIACYNAFPSKSGYWRCEDCLGDLGYPTVEEANRAIFGEKEERAS